MTLLLFFSCAFTRPKYQASIYRTIGPLVLIFALKQRWWLTVRTKSMCKSKKNGITSDNCHFYSRKNLNILHKYVKGGSTFLQTTGHHLRSLQFRDSHNMSRVTRKRVFGASNQARNKPGCTDTEECKRL